MCDFTHSCVYDHPCIRVRDLSSEDTTHIYFWHELYICVKWLVRIHKSPVELVEDSGLFKGITSTVPRSKVELKHFRQYVAWDGAGSHTTTHTTRHTATHPATHTTTHTTTHTRSSNTSDNRRHEMALDHLGQFDQIHCNDEINCNDGPHKVLSTTHTFFARLFWICSM